MNYDCSKLFRELHRMQQLHFYSPSQLLKMCTRMTYLRRLLLELDTFGAYAYCISLRYETISWYFCCGRQSESVRAQLIAVITVTFFALQQNGDISETCLYLNIKYFIWKQTYSVYVYIKFHVSIHRLVLYISLVST